MLAKQFKQDIELLRKADKEEFLKTDGIGEVLAASLKNYFDDKENSRRLDNLLKELEIEKGEDKTDNKLEGETFVITGSLERFKNRKELQALIEEKGAKVASSVSSKTTYLINNDKLSASSKNKKATELGVKVISEDDFLDMLK